MLASVIGLSGCGGKRRQGEGPVQTEGPVKTQQTPCGGGSTRTVRGTSDERASFVQRYREGPRVVLTGGQVAWLTKDALLRFDPTQAAEPQRVELVSPRGLAVAPNGVVALAQPGLEEVVRIGDTVERQRGGLGMTSEGVVRIWAEADGIWSVGATDIEWVPLPAPGKLFEIGRKLRLGVHGGPRDQVEVSRLSDGAFVHARGSAITRIATDDSRQELAVPADIGLAVAIAAAGPRAWLSLLGGGLALVDLSPVRLVTCVDLGANTHVHNFAADTGAVAVVVAEQATAGANPAWSLRVHDTAGKQLMSVPLPWQPIAADEPDLSVAIADGRVAIANAERLVVWDLATQKILVDRH